jgi:hypothetical protein
VACYFDYLYFTIDHNLKVLAGSSLSPQLYDLSVFPTVVSPTHLGHVLYSESPKAPAFNLSAITNFGHSYRQPELQ